MSVHLRAEIKKVRTRNMTTGFTVAEVIYLSYEGEEARTNRPIIVGTFPSIFAGDEFELEAEWIEHPKFGSQLKVLNSLRKLPRTKKGIASFIQRHAEGVGKVLSNRIVDEIGVNALSVIEQGWEPLAAIKGITEKKAQKIQASLFEHNKFEPISMFILNHGGSYQMALEVYEEYGDLSIKKVRENPYLLGENNAEGFSIADNFAEKLGTDPQSVPRFKKAIFAYLHERASNNGDLFAPQNEMFENMPDYMHKRGAFRHQLTNEVIHSFLVDAVNEMVKERTIRVEIQGDDEDRLVYLPYYYYMEEHIANRLYALNQEDRLPLVHSLDVEKWIEKQESTQGFAFAQRQQEAIYTVLEGGTSIVTGGPGTGKTQVINAILQCLLAYKKDAEVTLMAPTGKASKRMTEMTGIEAKTIHRAIGLRVGGKSEDMLLESDLVIIDETSMMDVPTCYRLLLAIQEGTSVVFVGDIDQLPSVGPGLVLRDFIRSGMLPTVELNEIFRQAKNSQIVLNAHAVIKGLKSTMKNGVSWDHSKDDFFFLERDDVNEAKSTLVASVRKFLDKGYGLEEIQILSPISTGPLGVWSLNQLLQKEFNPKRVGVKEVRMDDDITCFREGDRVIHLVNNKELDVFNGEVGIIDQIRMDKDRGQQVIVLYESEKKNEEPKEVAYSHDDLEELNLAYVTTVHKSQGSEYPVVVMICHKAVRSGLNRNNLYTGWTRAKQVVINIGNEEEMNAAIERMDQMNRNSKISEKLQERFTKSYA